MPVGKQSYEQTLDDGLLADDGFADFIGSYANCEAMIFWQPQLKVDLSELWGKPGQIYVGVEWAYWHNKYGIPGLEDKVVLPAFFWFL